MNSKDKNTISLTEVGETDIQFLYELLSERDSRANISHKKMPTYEEHTNFVVSKPYSKWYIITKNDQKVGSIYLTKQDEIGIFLKNKMQRMGIGKKALELLINHNPRPRYLANVSPSNRESTDFFQRNGFKLIQYTYELADPNLGK